MDCIDPEIHSYVLNSSTFDKKPVKLNVLLTALEPVSAAKINGLTIHQAFCIPSSIDRAALVQLNSIALERLRHHYANLRLIIIDDIHLVSLDLFYHIDTRLRQIINNNIVFGGISVILMGDLNRTHASISAAVYASVNTNPSIGANSLWQNFRLIEFTERFTQGIQPKLAMLDTKRSNPNSLSEIEMKRLRQSSLIPERFKILINENDKLYIIYHSIDAKLSTCLPFINSDYGFMNAAIIIFSKCHTHPKNNCNLLLNGYTLLKLTGSEIPNTSNGMAIYVQNKYIVGDKPSIIFCNDNSTNGLYTNNDALEIGAIKFMIRGPIFHKTCSICSVVHLCYFTIHVRDIAKSWKDFRTFIDQNIPKENEKKDTLKPLIVVGSLNYPRNLDHKRVTQILNQLPQRYGLINYVHTSTHDLNYTTDFCFTNCVQLLKHQVDVYESFYSHHKPIVITVDKN